MTVDRERSARIVAEAERIIALTSQIDEAAERVDVLCRDRINAMLELARLTGDGDASEILAGTNHVRTVADALLIVVMRAGSKGISTKEMTMTAQARLDKVPTKETLDTAIAILVASNEIKVRGDRYTSSLGKAGDRHSRIRRDGPTHREMVITILQEATEPLGIAAIVRAIKQRYNIPIPLTSLSPLLTTLDRKGGIVLHVGNRWAILRSQ